MRRDDVINPKGRGLAFEIACIEDCIVERKKLDKDCSFEERLLKSFKRVAKKRGIVLVTSGKSTHGVFKGVHDGRG